MVLLIVIALLFVLTVFSIGMAAHHRDSLHDPRRKRQFVRYAILAIVGFVVLLLVVYVNLGTLQHMHL